ncbi:MAG: DUF814 domain-containing protein [Planctomycetes bacterium]|nr:DUF814 domain-containing protein [Planctomycetota bacterium]
MAGSRGLSATELAAAIAELGELEGLRGATVLDVETIVAAPAQGDLLLVLQPDSRAKRFVHVALGSTRARICPTARRFAKADCGRGPARDRLRQRLIGSKLTALTAAAGERRCELVFAVPGEFAELRLAIELFSARGLWALLDGDGVVIAMSRPVETAVRTLRVGDRYEPPPARGDGASEPPPRFAPPVLAAIDAFFSAQDGVAAAGGEYDELVRLAERALAKTTAKADGLARQLAAADDAERLRTQADLMLAYAHGVPRGADHMTVADPTTGELLTLALDPSKPVQLQAQGLYGKARRLADGRAITADRKAEAEAAAATLARVLADLRAIDPTADDAAGRLAAARTALAALGVAPRTPSTAPGQAGTTGRTAGSASQRAAPAGENFRRFVSAEGYQILVGRNNQQNDRLTLRVANGNDVWLHVGGGRPGSHVVVRLPKQKTASLETLLDAATLAVHFSKARGERRIDVIYCLKKFVRKPKGLPAGAVVPSQTKTISVTLDEGRLRRLLDSGGGED